MSDVVAEIARIRIVPVVVIDDPAQAVDLAHALREGGVACAEFTLRTPGALAALAAAAEVPGFVVGAGTVLTAEQSARVVDAGARFVVSPGYDPRVTDRARELGAAVIPGIATASEIQRALADGLSELKVYPAALLGGAGFVDAMSGPFPGVRFMPSGGIGPAEARDYLARPAVLAVGGSWITPSAALRAGDFGRVRTLAADAAASVREAAA